MIKTFRDKLTENAFEGKFDKKIPNDIRRRCQMRLERIDYAEELNDLRVPPSHNLESLKGNRKGQHSIRVNRQWRICFIWKDGHAYDVEIVDYH